MTQTFRLQGAYEAEAEWTEPTDTWNDIIYGTLDWADPDGAGVTLERLFEELEEHPWTTDVPAWRSLVSLVLGTDECFEESGPGIWRIAPGSAA